MSPVHSLDTPEGQIISLFPSGTTLNEDRELLIGGCTPTELVNTFGSPSVIIDEKALRDRARRYQDGLRSRWPNSDVVWHQNHFLSHQYFASLAKKG